MKLQPQICEHCGQKKVVTANKLTPGLIGALRKIAAYSVQVKRRAVHTQKEVGLTHNQQCNLTKLRFHGLVAKAKKEDGTRRQGYWIVTRRGWDFLGGRIALPAYAFSYNNRVLHDFNPGEPNPHVTVRDIKGVEPFYETIDDIRQYPL